MTWTIYGSFGAADASSDQRGRGLAGPGAPAAGPSTSSSSGLSPSSGPSSPSSVTDGSAPLNAAGVPRLSATSAESEGEPVSGALAAATTIRVKQLFLSKKVLRLLAASSLSLWCFTILYALQRPRLCAPTKLSAHASGSLLPPTLRLPPLLPSYHAAAAILTLVASLTRDRGCLLRVGAGGAAACGRDHGGSAFRRANLYRLPVSAHSLPLCRLPLPDRSLPALSIPCADALFAEPCVYLSRSGRSATTACARQSLHGVSRYLDPGWCPLWWFGADTCPSSAP